MDRVTEKQTDMLRLAYAVREFAKKYGESYLSAAWVEESVMLWNGLEEKEKHISLYVYPDKVIFNFSTNEGEEIG